jgi:hypothetical protein
MLYCGLCHRWVYPVKNFNWAVFLLGLFLTSGILSVIYCVHYIFKRGDECPLCHGKSLTKQNYENNLVYKYNRG